MSPKQFKETDERNGMMSTRREEPRKPRVTDLSDHEDKGRGEEGKKSRSDPDCTSGDAMGGKASHKQISGIGGGGGVMLEKKGGGSETTGTTWIRGGEHRDINQLQFNGLQKGKETGGKDL